MKNSRSLVFKGILLALCLVFSYVEVLIPVPIPIPGFKLGLSNIVLVFVLFEFGFSSAFVIGILKTFVIFLLFGNLPALFLSVAGFLLSMSAMVILFKCGRFSVFGISAAGGIFHNIGQLLGAIILTGRPGVFKLMPVLSLLGALTGVAIGFLANLLIERIGKNDRIYKGNP